ncbi:MAG: amidohydrolase [Bacteroidota bacterium]
MLFVLNVEMIVETKPYQIWKYLPDRISSYLGIILLFGALSACQPKAERTAVDIAIYNATILTMDSAKSVLPQATILIKADRIFKIGSDSLLRDTYQAKETLNAKGSIVMPGLINTHTHLPMSLLRGIADDLPLQQWLEQYIWPVEAAVMDREAIRLGSQLAMAELIRSGTTCFNDMYFFADEIAKVADEVGLRGRVGEGILDYPTPSHPSAESAMEASVVLAKQYFSHKRLGVSICPHSPYACSAERLARADSLAQVLGIPLNIHLAETQTELGIVDERFSLTPAQYLDSLQVLRPGYIGAHGVWLNEADQTILASRGVAIAHCPESNMKLASGVAPVPALLHHGITVGLGTDGASSNNDLDLFEEMSSAAKLQKVHLMDPTALPAATVLEMATIGGARLMGWEDKIGSLEVGKAADLIVISVSAPHMQPLYDVFSQIVYVADGNDVTHTMVAGRWLMRDKRLLTLDQQQILADAKAMQERIIASLPVD